MTVPFSILTTSCSLVTAIAFMDLYRSEESRKSLETRFFEVLSLCKTTDDFKKVTELLKNLADIGGYAVEFYSYANTKINQKGKEEAIQILEERNKSAKKKTTDDLHQNYLSELAIEWKERYKIGRILFREMLENNKNNIIRTTFEEIDELIIRFLKELSDKEGIPTATWQDYKFRRKTDDTYNMNAFMNRQQILDEEKKDSYKRQLLKHFEESFKFRLIRREGNFSSFIIFLYSFSSKLFCSFSVKA